jgi:hypothetical protein
MIRLHWEGDKLMNGTRRVPIEVRPDDRWLEMYRVHFQGKISDIVNLTRAKDAAVAMVVASLNALQKPRAFSPTCVGAEEESLISGLWREAEPGAVGRAGVEPWLTAKARASSQLIGAHSVARRLEASIRLSLT